MLFESLTLDSSAQPCHVRHGSGCRGHHNFRGEDLAGGAFSVFELQITLWLWFTVLFATLRVGGRGARQGPGRGPQTRAHAGLRTIAQERPRRAGWPATSLKVDDVVVCEAQETIPADGDVIEGIASVDESAITGESAPVIRESGGDRSAVTGGTRVISDRIVIRVTAAPATVSWIA